MRLELQIYIVTGEKMKKSVRERIEKNLSEGKCIACGERDIWKRSCCSRCHSQFIRNRPLRKQDALIYDERCIAQGLIGESRQGRASRSPWRELAQDVVSKGG